MYGSDPPSSKPTFLSCLPASSATIAPTEVDPVRDTPSEYLIASFAFSPRVTEDLNVSRPKISLSFTLVPETKDACFKRTAFPAANAGTAARMNCHAGKFQGMMSRITPSGADLVE